ncbi:phosphatidate cytidylyltransferase [Geobacter pickeringii]|uniref:phosphatidate cytidylyltransferase n=1 Tax=Geobacter pickeringii TaxID=345632 RepID=UPI000AEE061E
MALPLLILLVLKGGIFLFALFIVLLTVLGLGEFYRMALPERKIDGVVVSLAGGCIPLFLTLPALAPGVVATQAVPGLVMPLLTTLFVACALRVLFSFRDIRFAAGEVAFFVAGLLYVPLLLTHLLWLRALPHGIDWIFLLLVVVMSGDTAAYYVGSSLGKHKLYPVVSPNKSVEGAIGGLCGSIAGAFIVKATFFPELSSGDCLAAALLMGPLGQVGDLFESLLKRSFGVKDSGVIIPGHGGVLDRLDSILFAAPAGYYYAVLFFMNR